MDLAEVDEVIRPGHEPGTTFESGEMQYPFPGMDPYLEHAVLWEGVHARPIVAIANQLQPKLDPRYIASVEERVFMEGPQRRIPEVWIQSLFRKISKPPDGGFWNRLSESGRRGGDASARRIGFGHRRHRRGGRPGDP